ncbi:uncharacterized protein [Periplaneta americana]|uniref:uncharacterized protein isoform X2 n=1 Tax=Periplaneta americana TaxID=6978 RepID=UPI0037E70ADB
MFISDVVWNNKEELYNVIINELRHIGLKHRIKKSIGKYSQHAKNGSAETRLFKVPLNHLENEVTLLLRCGTAVEVPSFVARACSYIKKHIETEGIFRKAGSTSRQRELKALLDSGRNFGPEHHVIDIANLLKMFFRELPEPLLPHSFHDVLLRCLLLRDKKLEGILLACLLLPTAHINTLAYLMQFLQEVASHSESNKMDVTNLAIIITPSVMPVEDKVVIHCATRLTHHVEVVELLIRNADKIGNLPENLSEKLAAFNSIPSLSTDEQDDDLSRQSKKKKKRRSGSLTRMLNGLKKMVGKGTPEVDENHLITSTPDFSTPCVKSSKKRKAAEVAGAFSSKKNPSRKLKSPQSVKSRHRRFFTPRSHGESATNKASGKEFHDNSKKSRLSVGSWSGKKQKPEEVANPLSCHSDRGNSLERSWSAGPWGRKKRLSLSDIPMFSPSIGSGVDITSDGSLTQAENSESEFVRIPKSEYEAIKSRVSAIENRISHEFGQIEERDADALPPLSGSDSSAEKVQTAYERTLEESEKLGDASTDQLAKRLSRELRIRRSLETKVIRSPSARKIGTIRRRSKENTKPEKREVTRNMSWHLAIRPSTAQVGEFYQRCSLKRGRPNTVFTGLPQPSPRNSTGMETNRVNLGHQEEVLHNCIPGDNAMNTTDLSHYLDFCREFDGPITRSKARRASSFHGSEWVFRNQCFNTYIKKSSSHGDVALTEAHTREVGNRATNIDEKSEWKTADVFFKSDQDVKEEVPVTGRASVAKLRSQNAGMVLERMKMFDRKAGHSLESERRAVELKAKKLVHVPSVFTSHSDATQSLRAQHSKSASVKKHGMRTSPGVSSVRENYKDSPKKIGTPRRKQGMKSPNVSQRKQKQKLKMVKSPSRVDQNATASPASVIRRKHNSMKLARDKVYASVKANVTAPVNWLTSDKENVLSPSENVCMHRDDLVDICSPTTFKASVSPLKDCTRIEVNSQDPGVINFTREAPYIKKALLTKSPNSFCRTPQSLLLSSEKSGRRRQTPMKAFPTVSCTTPVGSPKRQSPRLLILKSRNIS